jgi:hypothetical protein
MTTDFSIIRLGTLLAERYSDPIGLPNAMVVQAAVLLAGETPRYSELAWEDHGEQGLSLTLVLFTERRVVLVGPTIKPQGSTADASPAPAKAETWPLSKLCHVSLEGAGAIWATARDDVPLPHTCSWRLTFEGRAEPLRLPLSADADQKQRLQAAQLAHELLQRFG